MPDYPLPSSTPAELGFAQKPLEHLDHLIRGHIEEGRYPGAQIALARHGKLALFRTYGDAKTGDERTSARDDTLFLLVSDNGASQEGGPRGVFDEMKYFNLMAEDLDKAVQRLDDIGGSDSHCNCVSWLFLTNVMASCRRGWTGSARLPSMALAAPWTQSVNM